MNKKERKNKVQIKKAISTSGSKSTRYILGVDEVGRGPLAGPVTVCLSQVRSGSELFIKKELQKCAGRAYPVGKDSKKMSEVEREFWFEKLNRVSKKFQRTHKGIYLAFYVESKSAKEIDNKGIAVCISEIVDSLVSQVDFTQSKLRADAGLKTSHAVLSQTAIVKGDEKEFVISIASVYAKVTRDQYMKNLSKKPVFSQYKFDAHKGYGTAKHGIAIERYGFSREHRISFCRKYVLLKIKNPML
jgi:ribonuclease HII